MTDPLSEFIRGMAAVAGSRDRVVDVPPAPGLDVEFVWTKRELPQFSGGVPWHRWRRVGPDRWSDQPGFSHSWASLYCHYRQVRLTDPTTDPGN